MILYLLIYEFAPQINELRQLVESGKLLRTEECDVYLSVKAILSVIAGLSSKDKHESYLDAFFETNDGGITYILKEIIVFRGTITEIVLKHETDRRFKLKKFSVQIINK